MTSRSKLSRREREARTKIIQECNLDKQGQRGLDRYAARGHKYTEILRNARNGQRYTFTLNTKKLTRAMRKIGTSANEAAGSFSKMAAAAFRSIAVMIAEVT